MNDIIGWKSTVAFRRQSTEVFCKQRQTSIDYFHFSLQFNIFTDAILKPLSLEFELSDHDSFLSENIFMIFFLINYRFNKFWFFQETNIHWRKTEWATKWDIQLFIAEAVNNENYDITTKVNYRKRMNSCFIRLFLTSQFAVIINFRKTKKINETKTANDLVRH